MERHEFQLKTQSRDAFVDITGKVQQAVEDSGVRHGICLVYCPHTTAGITINENADPDVPKDILMALDRAHPWEAGYRHAEGNAAAHVKASFMGSSAQVIISEGRLLLGTWQSVFFCEFDGPRNRRVQIKIMQG